MKILVGLGNPGKQYALTRHNVGFLFLDYLSTYLRTKENLEVVWEEKPKFKAMIAEVSFNGEKLVLLKPLTYMNESGWAVSQYISWNKGISPTVILIHDDLDLPFGTYKLNTTKSPKVHYGIISVESYLKTKDFERVRLGVDNRENKSIPGINYVMGSFTSQELDALNSVFDGIIPQILVNKNEASASS